MSVLGVLGVSAAVLWAAGVLYSRWISRRVGEDPERSTPAVRINDGCDYVPTPTPVVFAHHYASIAGAGPIIGPVVAIVFGWVPALLWVLFGGVFVGAVHDYLATFLAVREGGHSVATIARRLLGKGVFVALVLFLIVSLALVCATFLNASATALVSSLPFDRIEMPQDQTLFRVIESPQGRRVVIGGIASTSVIVITAMAPLLGWMYIRRKVAVWKCSLLAVAICAASILAGIGRPVALSENAWKWVLSGYVLVAAGIPVWIFLQSRDFINVHLLYVGLMLLVLTLAVAGLKGASSPDPLPAFNLPQGQEALGPFWPMLFITIACGAVSGFHSLCAGGTTCKQLVSEPAARRVGYFGMILESFLGLCVIAVLMIGTGWMNYLRDVHPSLIGAPGKSNWILGFAVAVGNAGKIAFGAPVAVGALGGMILLEGFLVTTLDTAIRLSRYLIEEVWRVFFGRYDVFAASAPRRREEARRATAPAGSGDLPSALPLEGGESTEVPIPTRGIFRLLLKILSHYWVNSGIAVGLMILFAFSGGILSLWGLFATSNQLLAALVLGLAALWLWNQGRPPWFAVLPCLFMLATTGRSLILGLKQYGGGPKSNPTLLAADLVLIGLGLYLVGSGVAVALRRGRRPPEAGVPGPDV